MEGMMEEVKETVIAARIRAPRAGAVAGILFSILLFISLVLIRLSVPASPADPGTWLMGVLRDQMGGHEDRFLATVFLGSGLLFLAMTFASSAATGGLLIAYEATPEKFMDSGTYTFARTLGYELANVYALRMAGVFMFSTCTLAIRIGTFPRWMAFLGYALGLFLLLSIGRFGWAPLVFPSWSLVISVYVLFVNFRRPGVQGRTAIAPTL
jgi:hypothetical protein